MIYFFFFRTAPSLLSPPPHVIDPSRVSGKAVIRREVVARRMAFNNPSSRTPVSYGSATKSLGYIVGTLGRAFSSDDDEGAQLLSKKKAKGESRFMAYACCCCCAILVGTVGTFIWALQSMTYPGQVKGGCPRATSSCARCLRSPLARAH